MERLTNLGIDLVGEGYFNFDSHVKLLEANLQTLTCRASDVENDVTVAEGSGKKKRKREVENWLENVKKVKDDFAKLKNRYQEQGFMINPLRGNRIAELQDQVAGLLEQSQHFNELVLDTTGNRGMPRITSKLFGQLFKKNFDEILHCLMIDNISMVGVYGMGGVGKTTLVKHVHNHLLKNTNSRVHWFTIFQEFNMKRLQNQIAGAIHLDLLSEEDEEIRAIMLSRDLTEIKNLVIILDDVWECICLKNVGIPLGEKGCKVILTSRSSKLCDQMDCQRKFEVNTLHRDDAWDLFKYTLGPRTILQANTEKIAKSIAERCDGLPLGVITMAGSMKSVEDIHDWRDALEQLKSCQVADSKMDQKVFNVLGLSYNRLSTCQQQCLLHCSLYPEDSPIPRNVLISEFISAGLLEGRKTRKQEFDQGHRILNELVKVCLLEESHDRKCVKMHDLIRDMALWITSKDSMLLTSGAKPRFMVKAGMGLTEIPEQNEWAEDLEIVSLMSNAIDVISSLISPNCPKLSILILEDNRKLGSVPNSFFEKMIMSLQVLNLSGTSISEMPSCVSDMENLTTLLLYQCFHLKYVPGLGKLKKLRELDISETSIENIPQDLEKLESLKGLYMINQCKIPVGTLPKLYRLQYLHIRYVDASELEMLKHLEALWLELDSVCVYNKFIRTLHTINAYKIVVNDCSSTVANFRYPIERNALTLLNCSIGNKGDREANVVLLPENIQEIHVYKCFSSIKCLTDIFPQLKSLNDLISCHIVNSFEDVEYLLRLSIITSSIEQQASNGCAPLHSLEELTLTGLPNLVGLIKWESEVPSDYLPRGTFSNLKILLLWKNNKIRKLFPPSLLKNLQNLEGLYLGNCLNFEEVIAEDEMRGLEPFSSRNISAVLPKLKTIQLSDLPELKSIYSGSMTSDSISEILVIRCPELKRLPFSLPTIDGQLSCPKSLKKIQGSEEWWQSLEWDNPSARIALQPKFLPR